MCEGDFAVIENDHCDVLERHERRLILLDGKAELFAPQLGGARDDDATPGHDVSQAGQGNGYQERRR